MDINLEEIFENNFDCYTETMDTFNILAMSKECFIKQVKLICKQVLELAAENATIEGFEYKEDWMIEPFNMRQDELGNIVAISKKSIIDTINQIK